MLSTLKTESGQKGLSVLYWRKRQWSLNSVKTNTYLDLKLPRNLENRLCLEGMISKPRAAWTSPGQRASQSAKNFSLSPLMIFRTLDWHKVWWVAIWDGGWKCFEIFHTGGRKRTNSGHQREGVNRGHTISMRHRLTISLVVGKLNSELWKILIKPQVEDSWWTYF